MKMQTASDTYEGDGLIVSLSSSYAYIVPKHCRQVPVTGGRGDHSPGQGARSA